jgi:hypothetical protein
MAAALVLSVLCPAGAFLNVKDPMKHFYLKSLPTLLLLALLAGSSLPAWATHILGGELTYTLDPAKPQKIRAQLTLYTEFGLTEPDNVQATVYFGPDQSVTADRFRRTTMPDGNYKSTYFFDYVFPAAGTYTMSFREQNRPVGVVNIADSHIQAYLIATQVLIDPLGVSNLESAKFLTNPVHTVRLGQTVRHHIGAYEPEGDSLSFQLVPSLRGPNTPVTGYVLPDFIHLNAWTGALTYTNPDVAGQYAFTVQVTEYRDKKAIGYLIRDFTVMVLPPAVTFAQSLTVTPGAGISITPQNHIFISPNQVLSLQALLEDDQADSTRLQVYSDLFAKTNKLQVTGSSSGNTKMLDISLEADPALQRDAPYLLVLRAVSRKGRIQQLFPQEDMHTQELGFWVYIGSDIVDGVRPPDSGQGLRLYPNPAADVLYIDLPRFRPGLQLQVYTAGGQLVWQQVLLAGRTPLLRRHFAAGKYLYRIVPLSGYDHQGTAYSGRFIFR